VWRRGEEDNVEHVLVVSSRKSVAVCMGKMTPRRIFRESPSNEEAVRASISDAWIVLVG
jgi:hypothetical protein